MQKFLAKHFDEVRVIGYVRPPIGFKMSIFQQKVKHGKSSFDLEKILLNYRRKFQKFDKAFGRDNVLLLKFDPANFPRNCIVSDFCNQIGIEPPDPSTIERVNESLSRDACSLLYAYRKFGPGYGVGKSVVKENARIIQVLFRLKGAKFKISRKLIRKSITDELADVRWMRKRLGTKLGDPARDDGSEISSEEDLLTIKGSTCAEYAKHFQELNGVAIPPERIPQGEIVSPQAAAEFIEYCRGVCRGLIQANA